MIVTKEILDELTAKAKENPRLRMAMDLRNSPEDSSQRMLALPSSVMTGFAEPAHARYSERAPYALTGKT